jgi:hypothetical protein
LSILGGSRPKSDAKTSFQKFALLRRNLMPLSQLIAAALLFLSTSAAFAENDSLENFVLNLPSQYANQEIVATQSAKCSIQVSQNSTEQRITLYEIKGRIKNEIGLIIFEKHSQSTEVAWLAHACGNADVKVKSQKVADGVEILKLSCNADYIPVLSPRGTGEATLTIDASTRLLKRIQFKEQSGWWDNYYKASIDCSL